MLTIVFDLDDTLYDRTQPLQRAFIDFAPAKNLSFDCFQKAFTNNSDIAFERVKDEIWTLEVSHIYRIKETLAQLGVTINDVQAQSFQKSYLRHQEHIELYPHMMDTLDFLQRKEILTLIITNGPVNHQRTKIKNLGLNPYFKQDQILVSGEEGIAKPDVRIFQKAEERFHFNKKNAWYIGDSYHNDIVGASHAGWKTIWFNKSQQSEIQHSIKSTKTVSSPLELKEALFHLIGK